MRINEEGFLEGAEQHLSAAISGDFPEPPTLIVMHYTASGGDAETDARYFASRKKKGASAHLILGRAGKLYQSVPLTVIAHHAGRSVWRGRTGCNKFSIGIEIDNWGWLTQGLDNHYRSYIGSIVKDEQVYEGRHKNGGEHDLWERYPEVQLAALDELVEILLETYSSITDIAGHDDIAPNRKTDPGPAFPLKRYTDQLSKACDDEPLRREVWATSLNVRAEPNRNAALLDWGPMIKGEEVHVLVDAGDWSYIEVRPSGDVGWVFDKYLR